MAAAGRNLGRAERLLRIFREVRDRTGSRHAANVYIASYILAKLPRLFDAVFLAGIHRRSVAAAIARARTAITPGKALVAVLVTGGLGDLLIAARFLRDFQADCGPLAIDIFAGSLAQARWVFGDIAGVQNVRPEFQYPSVMRDYDLALRLNQAVTIEAEAARWTVLEANPALLAAAGSILHAQREAAAFIARHPQWDNFFAQTMVFANRTRADALHGMAGLRYGGDAFLLACDDAVLARHGLVRGGYITLHNGFDPNFFVRNHRATKCYPHFGAVAGLLKSRHPGLRIVQLGTHTSEAIAEADINLIDATSIQEAAGLLANARLHIDNEGGLVHVARCFGVPSCVVFGPTPSDYFGYAGNINIAPGFCGGCWWITETWMDKCPRGFATARCMTEQDPHTVADAITRHLEQSAGEAIPAAALAAE